MNLFKMVSIRDIPYYIGVIVILKFLYKIYDFIMKYIIPGKNNLKEKYGDGYAIVTGGTSGIGFAFATEFLKLNYKICLLSSNKEKLERAKNELLKSYPNSTIKIIEFNLDQFYTEETIKKLEEKISSEINGEEISILYNNAGVLFRGRFDSISQKNICSMINVNLFGLTILTKIVIEYMRKRQKKSLVIGSGSVDGQFRQPTRAVYSSTKSYLEAFYEVLNREFKDKIDFTLIEIGPVKTNMLKNDIMFGNSPEQFASECINLVGKYKFIQGSRNHAILKNLMYLPVTNYISRMVDAKKNVD